MIPNTYLKAAALGVIAGMRSMLAPCLVSRHLRHTQSDELVDSPLAWFATAANASVFSALAFGELVADKLPSIPARTDPGPLIGRALTGALSGSAFCVSEGEGLVEGAVVGALAAIASAHVFYRVRKWLDETLPAPDCVWAVTEDAVAFGLGHIALEAPDE